MLAAITTSCLRRTLATSSSSALLVPNLRCRSDSSSNITMRGFASAEGDHKVKTLEELEDVETFRKDNKKSVLYFTAVWCPPCKQIKPIYHDLSKTMSDKGVAFGLVDVDDNADAAVEFQITAVPTFVFSKGETSVQRFSGADPNQLNQLITDLAEQ